MSFFDDGNEFDDIVNQFFGSNGVRRRNSRARVSNEYQERSADFIQTDDSVYYLFELSGFEKDDIEVHLKGKTLDIKAKKIDFDGIKEYLVEKFSKGISFTRELGEESISKEFDYSMNNGILEIKFRRKK